MNDEIELLKAKLNLETARVDWTSLQRLFAQGSVIWVAASLDLIDVAQHIADDDSAQIKHWMADNQLAQVTDAQARQWLEADAWLWSVVVKPLVLVQETERDNKG